MTVCIVHYNTPDLTEACIKSLLKHTPDCNIIILDNSNRQRFDVSCATPYKIKVIDNTKGQKINFEEWLNTFPCKYPSDNDYASAKHCYSVQWLIDHTDKPFLLMDSDVLIRKDVTTLFDSRYAYVGEAKIHKSRFGSCMRVLPYLCYINVPLIKHQGVSFFNPNKMFALAHTRSDAAYDTGCWFYEDCAQHHLPVHGIKLEDYAIHFGHGSWRIKNFIAWLEDYKELWS